MTKLARLHIHYDLLNHLSCRSIITPFLKSESELEKINEQRNLNYNFNRSVSLGLLKDEVVKIFMTNKSDLVMKKLNELFLSHLEPVRLNRQSPHIIKVSKARGKHRNFLNYKNVL